MPTTSNVPRLASPAFSLRARDSGPGGCRAALFGEIDLAAAQQLRHQLAELARKHRSLRLDLSGVTFIDAAGLSLLMTTRRVCRARGTRLDVVGIRPPVGNLLRITGFAADLDARPPQPTVSA